jgi:hypothetical protein
VTKVFWRIVVLPQFEKCLRHKGLHGVTKIGQCLFWLKTLMQNVAGLDLD